MTRSVPLVLAFWIGGCGDPPTSPPAATPAEDAVPTELAEPPAVATQDATVTHLESVDRRRAPGNRGEVAPLARGENAFVARLELAPLVEIPPHRDPTEEYIYVIEGGGTILIDGKGHQLRPGSAVFMPANAEVSYANGPRPLVALQVFAGPAPSAKYDTWAPVAEN